MSTTASRRGLLGTLSASFFGITSARAVVAAQPVPAALPLPKPCFTGPDHMLLLYCDIFWGFLERLEDLRLSFPPNEESIETISNGIVAAAGLAADCHPLTSEGSVAQLRVLEYWEARA